MTNYKLKIEIWSDVQCPFCYIGKHKFENALENFKNKDQIEIIWKSFQLNPNLKTDQNTSTAEYLAKHKGVSLAEAKQMGNHVAQTGAKIGLAFNFETTVLANTFNAHQILHFAHSKGLQNELKEALFLAHFTNGINIDDKKNLAEIAFSVGISKEETLEVLNNNKYQNEVSFDISEARKFGINGVPFFVFDRKYAVSGAQDSSAFLQTLEKSFQEWKEENPSLSLDITEGENCDIDSNCA